MSRACTNVPGAFRRTRKWNLEPDGVRATGQALLRFARKQASIILFPVTFLLKMLCSLWGPDHALVLQLMCLPFFIGGGGFQSKDSRNLRVFGLGPKVAFLRLSGNVVG